MSKLVQRPPHLAENGVCWDATSKKAALFDECNRVAPHYQIDRHINPSPDGNLRAIVLDRRSDGRQIEVEFDHLSGILYEFAKSPFTDRVRRINLSGNIPAVSAGGSPSRIGRLRSWIARDVASFVSIATVVVGASAGLISYLLHPVKGQQIVEFEMASFVIEVIRSLSEICSAREGVHQREFSSYLVLFSPSPDGPTFRVMNHLASSETNLSRQSSNGPQLVGDHAIFDKAQRVDALHIADVGAFVEDARMSEGYQLPTTPRAAEHRSTVIVRITPSDRFDLPVPGRDHRRKPRKSSPQDAPIGLLAVYAQREDVFSGEDFDARSLVGIMKELADDIYFAFENESILEDKLYSLLKEEKVSPIRMERKWTRFPSMRRDASL